jgi:hypothetical protein
MARKKNVYQQIIEKIFLSRYRPKLRSFDFERGEIAAAAGDLGLATPKNLGDLVYSFRYRAEFPESIRERTPPGEDWIILPIGPARYRFTLTNQASILPSLNMAKTKIPDATPGVVTKYKLSDEQALLARLRYNRLIDVFLRLACYSLQNHMRTQIPDIGQIETDEIYVGIERRGAHYIIPVQAKAGKDRVSIVQVVQDFAFCKHRFPSLVCVPVAAQFLSDNEIALFSFEETASVPAVVNERHYQLVRPAQVTETDLKLYRSRLDDDPA